jgi:uncharacterized membrane protein
MSVVSGRPADQRYDPDDSTPHRKLARGLGQRWNAAGPMPVPPRVSWPPAVRRARMIGFVLIGIQFLMLCWWSNTLASRFALTRDFALFEQAAYQLAHGNLNPYSTVAGYYFWQDHAMFSFLPIALVQAIWPHPVTLLWVQNAIQAASEAVALAWICDIAANRADESRSTGAALALIALGAVLLVGNPWTAWSMSYDFHVEALGALFALLLARDIYRERKTAWVWLVLALLSGDTATTYALAVGLSALLMGRRWLRIGAAVSAASLAWIVLLEAIGLNHGQTYSIQTGYAHLIDDTTTLAASRAKGFMVLTAALEHPLRALGLLSSNRLNFWANISSGGILGFLWPPLLVPSVLLLLEGGLASGGAEFALPGFQNIALYTWLAVGSVGLCSTIHARRPHVGRWLFPAVVSALLLNAAIWSIAWLPHISSQWLRVSPATARTLQGLRSGIPAADPVIASQGIVGGFAYRSSVTALQSARIAVPVSNRHVWIILAPNQGIETASVGRTYEDIAALDADPQVRLVTAANGIWAFEALPGHKIKELQIRPSVKRYAPGWALTGAAGKTVRRGSRSTWYATGTSKAGYVIDKAYWRLKPGYYSATVSMSVSSSANLEVWDETTGALIKRTVVDETHGSKAVIANFRVLNTPAQHVYVGWGIWRNSPYHQPGNSLEIRVWSPGGNDRVSVYRVDISQAGH